MEEAVKGCMERTGKKAEIVTLEETIGLAYEVSNDALDPWFRVAVMIEEAKGFDLEKFKSTIVRSLSLIFLDQP